MRKLLSITLVLILALIWCTSCTKPKEVAIDDSYTLHVDSLESYIQSSLEQGSSLICSTDLEHWDTLSDYYSQRNYKPIWWKALTGDSASWDEFRTTLNHGNQHGLHPRYYYLPVINYYREQLSEMSTADSAYRLLADLEIMCSHAQIDLYQDVASGRTHPKELYGYTYMLPLKKHEDMDWEKFLGSRKKLKLLDNYHKNDTVYNYLKELLVHYQSELLKEKHAPIDFSPYPKISPGDTVKIIPQVIRKLKKTLEPDSSVLSLQEDTIYTDEMVEVIKRLQEKYQLAADGVMGFKTYRVINSASQEKINQIKANLERERWFSRPDPADAPFVYVNLPEYRVYLYYEDSVKNMAVCIGKNLPDNYDELVMRYTDSGWLHKLPKDMETPQISARVSMVVINPTWTVPKSIIKNEMYWQMRRDPTYLSRNHYEVYMGDSLLDSESIDWSRFKPNNIPYRIVQTPGTHNALGKVKYIFWNAFDIFMHDTPHKSKFKLPQRAVSHGCVRLEDPLLFGEFVMQSSRKYDSDDFRIMMGYEPLDEERLKDYDPEDSTAAIQPQDTLYKIRLHKPIPIYMDYRTIYFDRKGRASFCYDIYDQNKYILRRLDEM